MANTDQNGIQFIDNVVHGRKFDFSFNDLSYGEFLFKQAETYPNNVCNINADTGETETYASVKQRATRVALHLQNYGITSEDVILLCTYNTMDSIIPLYAAQYLGAKIASLDPTQSIRDCAYLIGLVQPKMIFFCCEATTLIAEALKSNECKPKLVLYESNNDQFIGFEEFLTPKENEASFRPSKVKNFNETAFIYFSSGTTGLPKGVTISHHAILYATEGLMYTNIVFDCSLHVTTFYWVSALIVLTSSFMVGGRRAVCRNCNVETLVSILSKLEVTFAFIASSYSYKLNEENTKSAIPNLNTWVFGGQAVTAKQMCKIQSLFPNSPIHLAYGMTEVAGFISVFEPKRDKKLYYLKDAVSSGKPLPGLSMKVVDLSTGKNLSFNQSGEIRIKTSATTLYYYNQTYSDICDSDGWLKTGDVGYFDENYCFYVVDRIKEMFKYQSWHIVPAVIESVILEHPAVLEAIVVGLPHEPDGEIPVGIVVLKDNYKTVTADDIINFVNEKVDERQQLRGGVKFVEEIPRTPSGKHSRKIARDIIFNL